MAEVVNLIDLGNTVSFRTDPITSVLILDYTTSLSHTSTTCTDNILADYALSHTPLSNIGSISRVNKNNARAIYIRNARNLITAP